ncbi:MAG: hypothetical protein ACSHX6_01175 [Akkermansiaceae bacterium]
MKNDTNNIQNQSPLNSVELNKDQLNELENDAVWTLLDNTEESSPVQASPMFSRNVMREIRLQHQDAPVSFWQRIFAPKFNKVALTLGATAVCALIVTTMTSEHNNADSLASVDTSFIEDISLEELSAYEEIVAAEAEAAKEDEFTYEMLDLASQDPFFISEEEIAIAMQM